MKKTILHIDINSYFATVLEQENPYLRGKVFGVAKGEGRTCLIAVSKAAKKVGLKTGMRLQEARLIYPKVFTVPARFTLYLEITRRLKKIFLNIAPSVFIYSLDEAFVDISDCLENIYSSPQGCAGIIQEKIKQECGEYVTCNIGISHNRFLAKMASEIAPKGTILEIHHANKDAYLAKVMFDEVCGIGFRLSQKLARFGVSHPYQIRFIPQSQLSDTFGPFWSAELLKMAYGEEPHLLEQLDKPPQQMKSVSRSITGYRLAKSESEIKKVLYNLTAEVVHKVRLMHLAGRQVGVSLKGGEGERWVQFTTLKQPVQQTREVFAIIYNQLYKSKKNSFPVIKFRVWLSLLQPVGQTNVTWLPEWHQHEAAERACDKVNQKYGLFTLRSGLLIQKQKVLRPEVTGFLGDRLFYDL